jgi:nucleotide-binding universal stress UspA family protein
MKTILVATDFSANATHAAEYACQVATQLHANLILCNAFVVPAEMPEVGLVAWPLYEYDEMLNDSASELNKLKTVLERKTNFTNFRPTISCVNEAGFVTEVINHTIAKENVKLVIAGTHGVTDFSEFLIGDHSSKLIDAAACMLLLVPPNTPIAPIRRIAFATDFKDPKKDLDNIYELITLLKPINAELHITYVHTDSLQTPEFKLWLDQFLVTISNKADYPNVYYRSIRDDSPGRGLDWLCEHGHIDLLAMVHREHSFFAKLFNVSHTQNMAKHINIPLLVMHQKK